MQQHGAEEQQRSHEPRQPERDPPGEAVDVLVQGFGGWKATHAAMLAYSCSVGA